MGLTTRPRPSTTSESCLPVPFHSINKINPNQIFKQLLTLIGKAIWFSLARRPLLSTLDAIFRHHENVRMQALAMSNERELRELRTLATLLPLSQVSLKLPWSPIIIALLMQAFLGEPSFTQRLLHKWPCIFTACSFKLYHMEILRQTYTQTKDRLI